jgi:hypothetical protein
MRQALVQLVADMNGKDASAVERPSRMRRFAMRRMAGCTMRAAHRLAGHRPDLVITSSGSVGLTKRWIARGVACLDPILLTKRAAKCHITGTIGNPKVSVRDASLVIRQPDHPEPLIAVHGVNLNMQVENTSSGYVLAVEPVEILKKEKLSSGLAAGLVRLVVPDLAADRQVAGDLSLSFETLRIPLACQEQMARCLVAAGKLQLHQVVFEAINPSCRL